LNHIKGSEYIIQARAVFVNNPERQQRADKTS